MPDRIHDSETLAEGQQVVIVTAFITAVFDGIKKVLLPKRAGSKKFLSGVYELPGGHLDFGEKPVEGLKREIREELGVNVKVDIPFAVYSYMNNVKKSHTIEIVFGAKIINPIEDIKLDPEIHSSADWFAEEELENVYSGDNEIDEEKFNIIRRGFELDSKIISG